MKKIFTTIAALLASLALLMGLVACGPTEYKITFEGEDGTQLAVVTVEKGEVPAYTGTAPQKAATPEFTYTFAGWKDADGVIYTEALPEATADATYTAAFTQTARTYTVTWSVNGTTTSETYAYGAAVAYEGAAPEKAEDAQYTYAFSGWSDGTETYAPDDTLPAASKDVTYTAQFAETIRSYTVTWHVGETTSTATFDYGVAAEYDGTPEKAQTASAVYTFEGWAKTADGDVLSEEELTVTGDVDLYAVFTESARKYTVKFVDDDGTTELSSEQFAYGTHPTYDGTPEKTATAQYTYTFDGWIYSGTTYSTSEELPAVNGEMTFTAHYAQTVNRYTVTWSVAGTTTTAQFEYNAMPDYGTTEPARADTDEHSYVFQGWAATENGAKLETLPPVTGDVTYYALFTEIERQYTVSWVIDGVTTTTRVTKNTAPEHDDAAKEATAQYTFTFKGWATSAGSEETVTLSEQIITQDTTYYAVFTQTINEYTIKFVVDGEETESTMEYGTKPSYNGGTDPSKAQTAQYTYTFEGWNDGETTYKTGAEIPTVTGNATYTAVFQATTRQYTITIKYYKGLQGTEAMKQDSTFTLDYGTILDASNTVAIEAVDEDSKHYLPNLFRIGGMITENKTYEVRYTEADIWDGTSVSDHLEGQGTAEAPYLISSAADLYYLSQQAYNKDYGAGQYYKMTKSIDLANHPWQPICYIGGNGTGWKYFQGNFNGDGHTIAGLFFNDATKTGAGLFTCVSGGSILENFVLQGDITVANRGAGLVYNLNGGTAKNITSYVNVTSKGAAGDQYIGGIIGTVNAASTLENLFSYGEVSSTGYRTGGVVGNLQVTGSTLTNCINYGNVTSAGKNTGGVVGATVSNATITGCKNYGEVEITGSGTNTENVGGIAGNISAATVTITQCENYGEVIGYTHVGGVAGQTTAAKVNNCKNYGTIRGRDGTNGEGFGGIVGWATANTAVQGNNNYGAVTGNQNVGGICGGVRGSVSDCTNEAEISANAHAGGICGTTIGATVTGCTNKGYVHGLAENKGDGYGGIVGWTTESSTVTGCENHGDITGYNDVGGVCGYLGKGSTCASEGETANTNDGKFSSVTTNEGNLIGYDANTAA